VPDQPIFLLFQKAPGFEADYLGRKSVLGRETEAVQIDQNGCSSAVYYFDPESFELVMSELVVPVHARGDSIRLIAVHKEFKNVNGVRLPSRSEEINLVTGEVIDGGEWTSIAGNTLGDTKIFLPPQVHPTGITVEAMLANQENIGWILKIQSFKVKGALLAICRPLPEATAHRATSCYIHRRGNRQVLVQRQEIASPGRNTVLIGRIHRPLGPTYSGVLSARGSGLWSIRPPFITADIRSGPRHETGAKVSS